MGQRRRVGGKGKGEGEGREIIEGTEVP
jgi:hypothetical protein